MKSKFFRVRIVQHTRLSFCGKKVDMFHKDLIGKVITVKKTEWDGAYYELKNGASILKSDCEIITK